VVALAHLVAFAASEAIANLAAVALDQRLFSLAVNSFQGVYGASHGRVSTAAVLAGRAQATAGLSWLCFGLGTLNHANAGVVSLAAYEAYEPPPLLSAIAADRPDELWARAGLGPVEVGEPRPGCAAEVNTVVYKTPDYLLASAQAHQPGERGGAEHVWQATLGPDAVVFVNHPACLSQADVYQPNFWRGNATLPRGAQWRDTLAACYAAPAGEGLGFTHAYFPVYAFDEYALEGPWAFARQGEAYLALLAANGLALTTHGAGAYRELRSEGYTNVWLCQMGRAALDGTFADFRARVQALAVDVHALNARWTSLRGDQLSFGWQAPFSVNGTEVPLSRYPRYDNPYALMARDARQLEIIHGGQGLRLNFA
jgi:hypothetical protein